MVFGEYMTLITKLIKNQGTFATSDHSRWSSDDIKIDTKFMVSLFRDDSRLEGRKKNYIRVIVAFSEDRNPKKSVIGISKKYVHSKRAPWCHLQICTILAATR
jgi:hypothetical protein